MEQQLNLTLTISIPPDYVVITKEDWDRLTQLELAGVWWNMKDLRARTGRSDDWIKEKILFQPRFKKILDVENGGFVFYPKANRQPWAFQATKMAAFLDERFAEIYT